MDTIDLSIISPDGLSVTTHRVKLSFFPNLKREFLVDENNQIAYIQALKVHAIEDPLNDDPSGIEFKYKEIEHNPNWKYFRFFSIFIHHISEQLDVNIVYGKDNKIWPVCTDDFRVANYIKLMSRTISSGLDSNDDYHFFIKFAPMSILLEN